MSDLGKIHSTIKTVPVRPVNKEQKKKEQSKKKKGKNLPKEENTSSNEHVNEYI
jgi:hypothetical protein